MARINVYDRSEYGDGELLGWFDDGRCTETIAEDTEWTGEYRAGVISGLQCGSEELLRTASGRWVRHYDSTREYSGPEFYEFLTDDEARTWLMKNNTSASDEVIARYFGEPEEEAGPSKGGRPAIGGTVSIALGTDLLARIDAARGETSRAEWLRQAAEGALAA